MILSWGLHAVKLIAIEVAMTNQEIAELLRQVSACYQILGGNRFKIIAYDRAAEGIEHATQEIKDIWQEGKLEEVPGIGKSIAESLDELFKTGKVKHFEQILSRLPASIYPLLLVPGIGPKKAFKLVNELKLLKKETVVADLEKAAKAHKIAPMEGFGEKSEQVILEGIEAFKKGQIKENRMDLPTADGIAQELLAHMRKLPAILRADPLGSLRRQVATIGDIDIAVATKKPEEVINHFLKYPHQKIIDRGPVGSTVLLHNGRQADLRVQRPEAYGAMLQYFTGSKHHNIKLRTYAVSKGLSLNEYGIKHVKTGKVDKHATEESLYRAIGMPYIPPELREDRGEVEAALRQAQGKPDGLPVLVKGEDIKGDLHMHANFQYASAHDLGASPLSEHLDIADELGYAYIGISDHNPAGTLAEKEVCSIMEKRKAYYEHALSSWTKRTRKDIHVFIMCEVDINPQGLLALPPSAFEFVDAVIVSLHSSFTQDKDTVTKRISRALTAHPKVRIFGHPTGRLISKREGVDADWREVLRVAREHDVAMEINSYPDRLDLPDALVCDAVGAGVKLCIDTDSHQAQQMYLYKYGVSVARRGWATKRDIINTREYNEFKKWLTKSG